MSRFTIRDLLLATVVVGLALGWWLDHSRRPATNPSPGSGPYELRFKGAKEDQVLLFNPQTGKCWERYSGDNKWIVFAEFEDTH